MALIGPGDILTVLLVLLAAALYFPRENAAAATSMPKQQEVVPLNATNLSVQWMKKEAKVVISAFGRQFELSLRPGKQSLDVCDAGAAAECGTDKLIVMEGNVTGGGNNVFLIFDTGSATFSGGFECNGVRYNIEEEEDGGGMVLVRGKERNFFPQRQQSDSLETVELESPHLHLKRESDRGNVCEVKVAVDMSLSTKLGGSIEKVSKLVMRIIAAANEVYRNQVLLTVQGRSLGVQFRLKQLVVATEELCASPNYTRSQICTSHSTMNADHFLRVHSQSDHSDYCLSYLLTNTDFRGTLGVAYVGGVCSKYGRVRDISSNIEEMRSTNTGFVSILDPQRGIEDAEHTFAHEVGHNFGAPHDSRGPCSNYDYLMAALAPRRETSTTRKFSSCSLEGIDKTLQDMSKGWKEWCFVPDAQSADIVVVSSYSGGSGGGGVAVGIAVAVCLGILLVLCICAYAYIKKIYCFSTKHQTKTVAPRLQWGKDHLAGAARTARSSLSSAFAMARDKFEKKERLVETEHEVRPAAANTRRKMPPPPPAALHATPAVISVVSPVGPNRNNFPPPPPSGVKPVAFPSLQGSKKPSPPQQQLKPPQTVRLPPPPLPPLRQQRQLYPGVKSPPPPRPPQPGSGGGGSKWDRNEGRRVKETDAHDNSGAAASAKDIKRAFEEMARRQQQQ